MSINLRHLLKRNRSNMETFILKNKLSTYELFYKYCVSRRIKPGITEDEYNSQYGKLFKEEITNVKTTSKQKEKAKQTKVKRNVSKPQTKTKRRTRVKKVKDT